MEVEVEVEVKVGSEGSEKWDIRTRMIFFTPASDAEGTEIAIVVFVFVLYICCGEEIWR